MKDLVDRISDEEAREEQRKRLVGSRSDVIFNSVLTALKERITRYNDRHPQGYGPNAIWIHHDFDSVKSWITVQKNIEPKTSFKLMFPINSGEMECAFVLGADEPKTTIILDVADSAPSFHVGRQQYSAETISDFLLLPLLTGKWDSRPTHSIGFKA